jgi:probable ATP-dependent RNA helicase DDX4
MNKFVDNAGIVGYLESETISYKEKLKIMSDFRKGIISVLIVSGDTKIIRSLNVPNVRTVINYDLPEDADDYIRKIGRCGRAYSSGNSITFFDSKKDKRSIINELEEV